MMAVLLELSNVKDPNHRGTDGTTLQGRMQRLIKNITKDITGCGNVCDAYTKKGIVGMWFRFWPHRTTLRLAVNV